MDYEYRLLHGKDMHNRCCGGQVWCVQVSSSDFATSHPLAVFISFDLWNCLHSATQDICGIICAVMTWLLILYAEFVVMVVIIWPSPYPVYSTINMIIFNFLAFLAYASHLRTMFSDPVSDSRFLVSRSACGKANDVHIFAFGQCLGCRAEGKCHERDDSTAGLQRGPSVFQMPKVLQHKAGTSPSLFRVSTMHS